MEKEFFLCDAHTHVTSEQDLKERIDHHIVSLINHSDPETIDSFFSRIHPPFLIPSFGLHPWDADKRSFQEMEPFLQKVPVIGEIGMDNVWCDVSLSSQSKVFESQLELACDLKKPVILHTKGQEKEIADIIRRYPNRYLVHWYSCKDHLQDYIDQGCYFSIGPDVWWNPATRNVARKVPLNRILTETDGLNAVQWAYDEAPDERKGSLLHVPDTTKKSLNLVIETVSEIRKIDKDQLKKTAYSNLVHGFLETDQ